MLLHWQILVVVVLLSGMAASTFCSFASSTSSSVSTVGERRPRQTTVTTVHTGTKWYQQQHTPQEEGRGGRECPGGQEGRQANLLPGDFILHCKLGGGLKRKEVFLMAIFYTAILKCCIYHKLQWLWEEGGVGRGLGNRSNSTWCWVKESRNVLTNGYSH